MMTLAQQLLAWYQKNARDLPWRQDKNAYKIWVSEIMLQQTRVEAVKEYYTRWIERFPTPQDLAEATEEEVLTYWQGLGYYSRARHLLEGVREVCASYGGQVPTEPELIQQLPGVGEYTAGAIASIAYGRPAPAIDGNVLRIFSRLFCLDENIAKASTKRKIRELLKNVLPPDHSGDFNQALMDLGATVCIPRSPRCSLCPLTRFCLAYESEVQDVLPLKSPKKPQPTIYLAAGIIKHQDTWLIHRRPAKSLLANMWEFPTVELSAEKTVKNALASAILQELAQEVAVGEKLFHCLHVFSHRKWDITFYECSWQIGGALPDDAQWLSPLAMDSVPWAGPHHKAARKLLANP